MQQRSEAWFAERAGNITASRLGDVIADPKTKRFQTYLNQLVVECSGAPPMDDEFKPWFQHGPVLEPIARDRYEFECLLKGDDTPVEEIGLIYHPKYNFISCSPDGVKQPKKGLEIKSSISHTSFLKTASMVAKNKLPAVYRPQVQGCLWITGFDSWDFVAFFRDPDEMLDDEIAIMTVEPDLKYHKMLEEKCLAFWELVEGKASEIEWIQDEEGVGLYD